MFKSNKDGRKEAEAAIYVLLEFYRNSDERDKYLVEQIAADKKDILVIRGDQHKPAIKEQIEERSKRGDDIEMIEVDTGLMGRWKYSHIDFDSANPRRLIIRDATRIPRKDGVIEEEFLIAGQNESRDITLQTRGLTAFEYERITRLSRELNIAIPFRVIVRDETAIRNRIYGAATQDTGFIREDILSEGNDEQIKEALDHENRELSRLSHDQIRGQQYQGDLRSLITQLSERDKDYIKDTSVVASPAGPQGPGASLKNQPSIPILKEGQMRFLAQESEYYQKGGWKLHLAVAPENFQAVHEWLWVNTNVAYKHRNAGLEELEDKDFTLYIGSKRDTDALARRISGEIGSLLLDAGGTTVYTDIQLAPKVWGRFDATGKNRDEYRVAQYGGMGLPYMVQDYRDKINLIHAYGKARSPQEEDTGKQEARERESEWAKRAFDRLQGILGDYFTGGAESPEGLAYTSSPLTAQESNPAVASSPAVPHNPGGIDFRFLPIITQAMSNLSAGFKLNDKAMLRLNSLNLDEELGQIQRMVEGGMIPSAERIKEYIQASCAKGEPTKDIDKVILCISDILRLEEERCVSTEPVLRDILIVLEANRSTKELKKVFLGQEV